MTKPSIIVATLLFALNVQATPHYKFKNSGFLYELEPAWQIVNDHLTGHAPNLIEIDLKPSRPSMFHLPNLIAIAESDWKERRMAVIAHETAHLAIGAMTSGKSATGPFRFIDEGLASLIEEAVFHLIPTGKGNFEVWS